MLAPQAGRISHERFESVQCLANANADAETELATAEHVVAALAARGASHNRTDASHVVVIDAEQPELARADGALTCCAVVLDPDFRWGPNY